MSSWLRWCASFVLFLVGCSTSHGDATVIVHVISDYAPGTEAARVDVTLYDGRLDSTGIVRTHVERTLAATDSLAEGVDAAHLEHVTFGDHAIRVSLRRGDGTQLATQVITRTISTDVTITVHIAADCEGITCPVPGGSAEAFQCIAHTCVQGACDPSTPEGRTLCPQSILCSNDADCETSTSICARNRCVAGACVSVPMANACMPNEHCERERGCVADPPVMPHDPSCGTICNIESEPCRYGYYACDDEMTSITCTLFVSRPVGTPCGDARTCDAHGACVTMVDAGLDASLDARIDARVDMSTDASFDARIDARVDMSADAARDASAPDAVPDSSPDAWIAADADLMNDPDAAEVLDAAIEDATPTDPCSPNPCGLGSCNPFPMGSYWCTCAPGYIGGSGTCVDINECLIGTDTCSLNQHCENEPGTYSCHDIESVATGLRDTCVVFDNGRVKCWGSNYTGELGYPSSGHIQAPISAALALDARVTRISAGSDQTCALIDDGTARCWGSNGYGQLGYGDVVYRSSPPTTSIDFGPSVGVTAIETFTLHTCALRDDGRIVCWGNNDYGQLGHGDMTSRTSPDEDGLDFGQNAVSFAMGYAHACALLEDGNVRCWGWNLFGQLGYGDTMNRPTPPTANVNLGERATKIDIGNNTTCALLESGSVKCWGSGQEGSLGYGDKVDRIQPGDALALGERAVDIMVGFGGKACARLESGAFKCWGAAPLNLGYEETSVRLLPPTESVDLNGTISMLSGRNGHTCALYTDGTLGCWGANNFGQLGYGDRFMRTTPSTTPLTFSTSVVSAGAKGRTCIVTADGNTRCWGDNLLGVLGYADGNPRYFPESTPVDTGISASLIASGGSHNCIYGAGHLRCWGQNGAGQLGYFNNFDTISGPLTQDVTIASSPTALALGNTFSCALGADHAVRCWGHNYVGQLGYGDTTSRSAPESSGVALGGNAIAVSANSAFACAILDGGAVKCWGDNSYGQLGYGDTTSRSAPPSSGIALGGPAIAISMGTDHACAVLSDGDVKCWGNGMFGRLGYGDSTNRTAPPSTAVTLERDAIAVAAGTEHTCALLDDGNVQCWGWNSAGELGYGDTSVRSTPGPVLHLPHPAIALVAAKHTCAILNEGSLSCWGDNSAGQLGDGYGIHPTPPTERVNVRGRL